MCHPFQGLAKQTAQVEGKTWNSLWHLSDSVSAGKGTDERSVNKPKSSCKARAVKKDRKRKKMYRQETNVKILLVSNHVHMRHFCLDFDVVYWRSWCIASRGPSATLSRNTPGLPLTKTFFQYRNYEYRQKKKKKELVPLQVGMHGRHPWFTCHLPQLKSLQ